MKDTLISEAPVTKDGLETYIREMKKAFAPVKEQYRRMDKLLTEAQRRLIKIIEHPNSRIGVDHGTGE